MVEVFPDTEPKSTRFHQ